MPESVTVRVSDIISSSAYVSDGQHLHDKIALRLKAGLAVVLSFKRIDILVPAFLNAAVGRRYNKLTEDSY